MKAPGFKLIHKGKKEGIIYGYCGNTSWEWKDVRNRYCSKCELQLETPMQKSWREYKEKPEYQTSAFPFPPRRKSLFDKLHDDFLALVILGGFVYIIIKIIIWLV